jgi:hypothetical protein
VLSFDKIPVGEKGLYNSKTKLFALHDTATRDIEEFFLYHHTSPPGTSLENISDIFTAVSEAKNGFLYLNDKYQYADFVLNVWILREVSSFVSYTRTLRDLHWFLSDQSLLSIIQS